MVSSQGRGALDRLIVIKNRCHLSLCPDVLLPSFILCPISVLLLPILYYSSTSSYSSFSSFRLTPLAFYTFSTILITIASPSFNLFLSSSLLYLFPSFLRLSLCSSFPRLFPSLLGLWRPCEACCVDLPSKGARAGLWSCRVCHLSGQVRGSWHSGSPWWIETGGSASSGRQGVRLRQQCTCFSNGTERSEVYIFTRCFFGVASDMRIKRREAKREMSEYPC